MKGSSLLAPIAKRLEGKVALITGGASGIGQATARLFVQHGAKVVIADVQDELGHSVCNEMGSGETISFVHCDVSNEHNVKEAIDTAIKMYNKLDIMFSNAGIGGLIESSITAADSENLKRVFEVNVFGAFYCAKYAARAMIPAKTGSILFTASAASETAGTSPHPYKSAKHAIVGLAKNLCVELGQHGIRVNCISPFLVDTQSTAKDLGISKEIVEEISSESSVLKEHILEAKDVAEAAVYLGSDDSKYVSGLNFLLDGGYTTTNPTISHVVRKKLS